MKALNKGTRVRQVLKPIEGEVLRATTDGENFGYMVGYTGEDGQPHERFFRADAIEEVKEGA